MARVLARVGAAGYPHQYYLRADPRAAGGCVCVRVRGIRISILGCRSPLAMRAQCLAPRLHFPRSERIRTAVDCAVWGHLQLERLLTHIDTTLLVALIAAVVALFGFLVGTHIPE